MAINIANAVSIAIFVGVNRFVVVVVAFVVAVISIGTFSNDKAVHDTANSNLFTTIQSKYWFTFYRSRDFRFQYIVVNSLQDG